MHCDVFIQYFRKYSPSLGRTNWRWWLPNYCHSPGLGCHTLLECGKEEADDTIKLLTSTLVPLIVEMFDTITHGLHKKSSRREGEFTLKLIHDVDTEEILR